MRKLHFRSSSKYKSNVVIWNISFLYSRAIFFTVVPALYFAARGQEAIIPQLSTKTSPFLRPPFFGFAFFSLEDARRGGGDYAPYFQEGNPLQMEITRRMACRLLCQFVEATKKKRQRQVRQHLLIYMGAKAKERIGCFRSQLVIFWSSSTRIF